MSTNGFKLSPPWTTYWRQLEALFNGDPDIEIGQLYDTDDKKEIWIYVSNEKKFRALNNLLPKYHTFGNVKVKNVLKLKGIEALKDVSDGRATKIYMPSDIANVISSLGMVGEAMGIGDATAVDTSPKPEAPVKKDECIDEDTGLGGIEAYMTTEDIKKDVEEMYQQ